MLNKDIKTSHTIDNVCFLSLFGCLDLICHVVLRHVCSWCLAVQLEKQLPLLQLIRLIQTTIMEIGTEISKKIRVSNSAG